MSTQTPRADGSTTPAAPPTPQPRLLPLASLLGDFADDAAARHDARTRGVARGPVTGLPSLDRVLGDCLEPGKHVCHGGPGVGKTAFGLQLAAGCGFPSLVVTTEMHVMELLRRTIARETETYLGRLKSGEYDPETVLKKAREAIAKVPQLYLADATAAYADPAWLRDAARIVRGESQHLLIVLDSVHSWAASAGADRYLTEYERLDAALDTLGALARELGCPILAIAERNRLSMKDGGLHASAGTRAFEYDSESVLSLDVDKQAPAPAADEKIVKLEVAKNRNGSLHPGLKLAFHGALQRFRDLSGEPGR